MKKATPSSCLVLYDGGCNFCDGFAHWVSQRDSEQRCYFVARQSPAGEAVMEHYGISPETVDGTVCVVVGNEVRLRSSGVLTVFERLDAPWNALAIARWFPERLRDCVYRAVSANRYRWFGKREACRAPTGEQRGRFLQGREEVTRWLKEESA